MQQLAVGADAAQRLVDYVNSANAVARFAAAVNGTSLPDLVTPPQHYGDFADALATAKLHAMSWIEEMLPTFTSVPASIVEFNGVVQQHLTSVLDQLASLKKDTHDTAARAAIVTSLQALHQQLEPFLGTVAGLDSWVSRYDSRISPDATTLADLSQSLLDAEKVDQSALAKLGQSVDMLRQLIDSRNELVTLDLVGNLTLAVFIAVEGGAIGAPFVGAAAIIVGIGFGVVTGGFTVLVPVAAPPDYEESLRHIQALLNDVQTEIGAVNSLIGMLKLTSSQFDGLVTTAKAAGTDASQVLAFWKQWHTGLADTLAELEAGRDALSTPAGVDAAEQDVRKAQRSWSDLETVMTALAGMTYQLQPGVHLPPADPSSNPTG